jgi:hypothetical protein
VGASIASDPAETASSAADSSRVEAKRCSGRLARHVATTLSSFGGRPGRSDASGGGSSRITAASVSSGVWPSKARRPLSIS